MIGLCFRDLAEEFFHEWSRKIEDRSPAANSRIGATKGRYDIAEVGVVPFVAEEVSGFGAGFWIASRAAIKVLTIP